MKQKYKNINFELKRLTVAESGIIVSTLIAVSAIPVAAMIVISSGTSIAVITKLLKKQISTRSRLT